MKKAIITLLVLLCVEMLGLSYTIDRVKNSDAYLKNAIVKLYSKAGSCTGEEVIGSKSNKIYTLTAAHCRELFKKDGIPVSVFAQLQNNKVVEVYFIAEDPASDLMLLTAAGTQSLEIAKSVMFPERVHSITHGLGFPAFRTDGLLLGSVKIGVPIFSLSSAEDILRCAAMPKYQIDPLNGVCILVADEYISNDYILPGSSGGALLDSDNHIIGIATAKSPDFSSWVQLKFIQSFLSDK
jgi:hypothetical protein